MEVHVVDDWLPWEAERSVSRSGVGFDLAEGNRRGGALLGSIVLVADDPSSAFVCHSVLW